MYVAKQFLAIRKIVSKYCGLFQTKNNLIKTPNKKHSRDTLAVTLFETLSSCKNLNRERGCLI